MIKEIKNLIETYQFVFSKVRTKYSIVSETLGNVEVTKETFPRFVEEVYEVNFKTVFGTIGYFASYSHHEKKTVEKNDITMADLKNRMLEEIEQREFSELAKYNFLKKDGNVNGDNFVETGDK